MAIPERIERYEVLGVLGKGAMGAVYRGFDPKLRREVAIKTVASDGTTASIKARERFHREVCALAALRNPNIIEVYDYSGMESELLYYVMEKLDGCDLFNLLHSNGPMPEVVVAAIGHEICLALKVAHQAGIIHRDLKPENVFLDMSGRVVLTDFGVAKAVREDSAIGGFGKPTEVIGTLGFMAPELLTNQPLGRYTDIFALGVMLYNLLLGRLPFAEESPIELHRSMMVGRFVDPREYDPRVSAELSDIITGCLEAKPKRRPQSADDVRVVLKSILDSHGVTDVREDLRKYTHDAAGYVRDAGERARKYLIERMKVAVKDRDSGALTRLSQRLLKLDPSSDEFGGVSGVIDIISAVPSNEGAQNDAFIGTVTEMLGNKGSPPSASTATRRTTHGGRRRGSATSTVVALLLLLVLLSGVGTLLVLPGSPLAPIVASFTASLLTQQPSPSRTASVRQNQDQLRPQAQAQPQSDSGRTDSHQSGPQSGQPSANASAGTSDGSNKSPSVADQGTIKVRLRNGSANVSIDGERLSANDLRNGKRVTVGVHRIEVQKRPRPLTMDVRVRPNANLLIEADLRRGRIGFQ